MNRVFVDMDGVIVDFDGYMRNNAMTVNEVKYTPGAYRNMKPIEGAIAAVRRLIELGFDVWIATKPPTGGVHAYSEKAEWILEYLPELKRKIIITHDKGLLGDSKDYLCDDRPHKANCEKFAGKLIRFVDGYHWPQAIEYFESLFKKKEIEPVDILQIVKQRILEGWILSEHHDGRLFVIPPITDARYYWCAEWKPIFDPQTGKNYVYPHWIANETV